MKVIKEKNKKEYNYLSRYETLPIYYNNQDRKRYYGTAKQLSRELTSYKLHIVKQGESLDSLALFYYNNPLLWWVIADINSIQNPLELEEDRKLFIPDINEVVFTDSIRKGY